MLDFFVLAQIDGVFTTGGAEGDALSIVKDSIALTQSTIQAWQTTWSNAFNPLDGGLWLGLIDLGRILAGFSILYLALRDGSEIIKKQSWADLAGFFVWPLIIVFFLSGNGALLAQTVRGIRTIGYSQTQKVLDFQLGELTFRKALSQQGISSAAKEEIQNLYAECQGLVGEELVKCWSGKAESANAIVQRAEAQAKTSLKSLTKFALGFTAAAATVAAPPPVQGAIGTAVAGEAIRQNILVRDALVPLLRAALYALQWMVANLLEAALLLTALFAPIAMGLSLLPFQGRPIIAWLVGFLSLFGVQLGYNMLVGVVASIIVESGAELVTDIGFAMFLAFGAPILSLLIAGGGGLAIYRGLSSNASQIIDFASNAMSTATMQVVRAANKR